MILARYVVECRDIALVVTKFCFHCMMDISSQVSHDGTFHVFYKHRCKCNLLSALSSEARWKWWNLLSCALPWPEVAYLCMWETCKQHLTWLNELRCSHLGNGRGIHKRRGTREKKTVVASWEYTYELLPQFCSLVQNRPTVHLKKGEQTCSWRHLRTVCTVSLGGARIAPLTNQVP